MCSIVPVAQMVGSNRIVKAHKIVTPVGNANLDPIVEKAFRRSLIEKALDALTEDAKGEQLE